MHPVLEQVDWDSEGAAAVELLRALLRFDTTNPPGNEAECVEFLADTLRGLGFGDEDFALPLSALSGGQKKLVGLAKLLIEQPELLLLDEPDNHLDLRGKEFLEKLIADYPSAVVIVSHDRYLLDIVAEEIAELEDGRLTLYVGNYSEYQFEKRQKLLRQQQMFQVQQRDIQRLEQRTHAVIGAQKGDQETARETNAQRRMPALGQPLQLAVHQIDQPRRDISLHVGEMAEDRRGVGHEAVEGYECRKRRKANP